jgi:pimeloyl-ACP methyl ester carboxylesterase
MEWSAVDTVAVVHREVRVANRHVTVRAAGDPDGSAVLYFHGTPGSRLDVAFGDAVARDVGVRTVSFDRPGYGGSEPAAFGLTRIARDAEVIADTLGIERFATFGWSGGGPFALATAAVLGDRVARVGVASAPGPFQEVPGALEALGEADRAALSLLPAEPARAAQEFCVGSEIMLAVRDDEAALMMGMEALFGEADADVFADSVLRHHLFVMINEGLRQGVTAGGWDNVAYVGPWDADLNHVRCPVHLWYGGSDQMIPLAHGQWLASHLAQANLITFPGEGHLGPMRHWRELLEVLVDPAS